MAFKIKTYAEIVKMSAEAVDVALAPVREKMARSKANLEEAKLQEEMIDLEGKIVALCSKRDLDLQNIADLMDKYELKERRLKQMGELIGQLFPKKG
jgi:hypothetical protein